MAELGNPLKSANFGELGVSPTVQETGSNVTFRSRRVTADARVVDQLGLEPAERVNNVSVDHDLEVEVAARGGARGAAEGYDVAAGDLLADLDEEDDRWLYVVSRPFPWSITTRFPPP